MKIFIKRLILLSLLFMTQQAIAQEHGVEVVLAVTDKGILFNMDTISLSDVESISAIYAFSIYKEKIYKLKITKFQMLIFKNGEYGIPIKCDTEQLTAEMKRELKKLNKNDNVQINFEGIYSKFIEPGEEFGKIRTLSLMKLIVK